MADGQPIEGEKDAYYRVTPDMEGREISVVLTGKEREGQVVSEPTQKIAAPKVPSDHLIINQVYGGGGTDGVPVSHSYIELYNPTETNVDLSGYSIGYLSNRSSSKAGSTSGTVHSLQLQGTLPAKAFYLIRCAAENTAGAQVILEITQFDQEWEQTIDNKQYQVMLMQGDQRIDGVAVNEAALEGQPLQDPAGDEILSKNKCVRRIGFADTDDNVSDFEVLNLTKIPEKIRKMDRPRNKAARVLPVQNREEQEVWAAVPEDQEVQELRLLPHPPLPRLLPLDQRILN